jgi:hypothetical protein
LSETRRIIEKTQGRAGAIYLAVLLARSGASNSWTRKEKSRYRRSRRSEGKQPEDYLKQQESFQKTQESGRSNLPCSFAGEVGSEQFLNEKREESLSSFSALRVGAPAAAEAAAASGIDIFWATLRERRRKERGNLTKGEGTLGRGEDNSAGTRSRQKLLQPSDILFDTQAIQFEEGERRESTSGDQSS